MKLKCVSRYTSSKGSFTPGEIVDVRDEEGAYLLSDSPGSFEEVIEREDSLEEATEQVNEKIAAMSTETETGIVAPDRRARGGRKRGRR